MSNTFVLKESNVPGKAPLTTDLVLGELGVNTHDGRVYLKKNVSGTESIIEVSTQYDNTDTQFTSTLVNDVLDEIDGILDTKVTLDSAATLSELIVGTATNNSQFEPDGTLVFNGASTVWLDIDFPIIIRNTGPNVPVLSTLIGNITVPQWSIGDLNVCEGQEMIHAWKEGTDAHWHCHIITNGLDTTDRYVNFRVEAVVATLNGTISAVQTFDSGDVLIPANTPDRTHIIVPIGVMGMSGNTIGTQVYARLERIASTGTAPSVDPFCSMLQMHIECDTVGSRLIGTK